MNIIKPHLNKSILTFKTYITFFSLLLFLLLCLVGISYGQKTGDLLHDNSFLLRQKKTESHLMYFLSNQRSYIINALFFDNSINHKLTSPVILKPFNAQESDIHIIFVDAIRKGINDEVGVCRDLKDLILVFKTNKPSETTSLFETVKQSLAGNPPALSLLTKITENGCPSSSEKPFESLSIKTDGVEERLALLVSISVKTNKPGIFYDAVDAFAKKNGLTPEIFDLALRVQILLGENNTNGGLFWRDEIIPAVLQFGWQDSDLIAASTGGELPDKWKPTENYLKPWLNQRSLSPNNILPVVDGFLKPRRTSYRPVASHPLVLRLLHPKVFNSLSSTETQQFISWLAGQSSIDPEATFSDGVFILEAANASGVFIDENGNLQGNNIWIAPTKQVLDALVLGSDIGEKVPPKWQNKQPRLDELYQSCKICQQNFLGAKTGADALRQYGQARMLVEWNKFFNESQKRANFILTATPQKISDLVTEAKLARSNMDTLMGNPLCAPWLAKVSDVNPPKSLEAGILLRWYISHLKPRDLLQAIDKHWTPLTTDLSNKSSTSPAQRLAFIEKFSAWEITRGAWFNKTVSPTANFQPRSPWNEISLSILIANELEQLKEWLANPQTLPKDENILSSLAAICWFGAPSVSDSKKLEKALTDAIASPTISTDEKVFLNACKMELVTTLISAGEEFNEVLNDNSFLGISEVKSLPQTVTDLYKDGRPFAVRAATDITWIAGKRFSAVQGSSITETAVKNTTTGNDLQGRESREIARNMLKALDSLLTESVNTTKNDIIQSGFSLELAALELNLAKGIPDTAVTNSRKLRRESLATIASDTLKPNAMGSSFWGIDVWLGQWQRELVALQESRLLTVQPISFRLSRLTESHKRFLGATAAILSQTQSPQTTSLDAWQEPTLWNIYIEKKNGEISKKDLPLKTKTNSLDTLVISSRISSYPWQSADQPMLMLKPLLESFWLTESATKKLNSDQTDLDGFNDKYLPNRTWAEGRRNLDSAATELEKLENSIRQQYNVIQIDNTINSLKPLLSAPLVVNISSFREELSAAIADVRRSESNLESRKRESIAAELEVKAQELLTKIYQLEKERTGILLEITQNEVKIADFGNQISKINEQISKLNKGIAEDAVKIADLEKQKKDLEEQKAKIEVQIAARTVAVLKNQLKLLEDLIYTKTPNPDAPTDRTKDLSGQLGVIAYIAEKKVNVQLNDINNRKNELQKQLDDLREASFIKGITKFIGAVVGFVIGGPGGVQMGALIGEAVGGIIAGVKQGKPFGEIFLNTLQTGIQIAAASGVDLNKEYRNYMAESGELGKDIEKAQKIIGPLLKELPKFLTKDNLNNAFTIPGVDKSLENVLKRLRDDTLSRIGTISLPEDTNELVKNVGPLVLTGTPEEIRKRLKDEILTSLRNLPVDPELRKAADELGVIVGKDFDEDQLKEQMAEKLSTLGIVKSIPQIAATRDRYIQRFMISLTAFQDVLRKGNFQNVRDAVISQAFKNKLPATEYEAQVKWISAVYEDIQLSPNQELPWSKLQPKLREALTQLFPNDPERLELLIGQFQSQLDSDGMQAEIQKTLNPWNQALQTRMEKVDQVMARPCTQDDDEDRIGCQIDILNDGANSLQGNVLNWLRDGNTTEYQTLRDEVSKKREQLEIAEAKLKITNLDWQGAGLALEQAGFLKHQADLKNEIATLGKSVATLSLQQSDLALQNANLEVRRVKLESEQNLLNELSSDTRKQSLQQLQAASKSMVDAATADLESAVARARAARNRGVVYGKVSGWYANLEPTDDSQPNIELSKLIEEHHQQVEYAGEIVRDLLRLLRISGGKFEGYSIAKPQEHWSTKTREISKDLDKRFKDIGLSAPTWFETELNEEQIQQLFSTEGLNIYLEQQDPLKLAKLEKEKNNSNWYPIAPRARYQRVFLTFLMAEDESGSPSQQNSWVPEKVKHDTAAPVITKVGSNYWRDYLLTKNKVEATLLPWEAPIGDRNKRLLQATVYKQVADFFGAGDIAGVFTKETFQSQPGMPLTGNYHLKITGVPPKRARLVFVYTESSQSP
jgi:hypothetical protein